MLNHIKNHIKLFITMGVAVLIFLSLFIFGYTQIRNNGEIMQTEIDEYREMIGDGMVEKRAVFVIFNDKAECEKFIAEHGGDEHPENAGIGIVPMMETGTYNITGKTKLENVFDNLSDGEYTKEPVDYSGKYVYLKRIEEYNPMDDDEIVREMIKMDRAVEKERGNME